MALGLFLISGASDAWAETTTVAITESGNNPRVVTVQAGSQVIWTNRGSQPHTATSDGVWNSGRLAVSSQFAFSFNQPGRYRYNCEIHPRITGEIIVEGGVVNSPPSVPTSTGPAPATVSPSSSPPTQPTAVATTIPAIATATPSP